MIGGKKKLFEDFKKKAENGNASACYKCGEMLYSGEKVDQNKELAAFYFKKAADNGNVEGALKYATMLYKGDGIQSNFEEALHYYKILADNPDSNGNQIYKYAKFLLNKNCAAFDAVEGLKYLEKAADLRSEKAALRLGNILYNGDFGVNVDKVKASQFYEIAADKNIAIAMCNLGLMLMNGDGIEMNKKRALSLFANAANLNNLTGIDNYLKLLNEGVQEK